MKTSTSTKLYILIAIFILGFASLYTLNQVYTGLVHKLDKKTKNYEAKIKLGEYIAEDILRIKSLFFQLATTTTSKRSREIIENKIDDVSTDIESTLNVLEHGGKLKKTIYLNVVGHSSTVQITNYIKNDDKLVVEVIDIKPKLIDLESMVNEADTLLRNKEHMRKLKNMKKFQSATKKIRRFFKTKPAFFQRMSENIRRLLYESTLELNKIKLQIQERKTKYMKIKMGLILLVIAIVIGIGYWISQIINKENETLLSLNKEFKKAEASIRGILDAQPNIIIVSDGVHMIDANLALTEFFDKYTTLDDFKENHECICEFFEHADDHDDYIERKDYNGKNWLEYILANPTLPLKVIMKKDGIPYHFSILARKKIIGNDGSFIIIVSLNDITQVVEEVQKGREKDKQMIQQSRFAALGEMIGNIAHQWRQPLSAISSTSSSMQLQMQLGLTNDDEITESYTKIIGYVDFLTQTIEDFRGFFKEDKELVEFNVNAIVETTISIVSATYKDKDIELTINLNQEELISIGMPSELSQVFLNVLNNARDAIEELNPDNRIVHLRTTTEENKNIVYIQDNAGGIPPNIIDKIFDPYFTTKHQSQGTGIGLYMSKDIVEKTLKGSISVKNQEIELDGNLYNGACFKIALPIKS